MEASPGATGPPMSRLGNRLHSPLRRSSSETRCGFTSSRSSCFTGNGARSVAVLGDLPIFVAYDSADVWAHRDLFRLDRQGRPTVVAGVPPDAFTAEGQFWGNPIYDWKRNAETGYSWWIDRVRSALRQVDLLRIDHFRAFAASWVVPADAPTAAAGHWEQGPGRAIFDAMEHALGDLSFIVEDLGLITPDVVALREELGFPGMRVLQFAFDSGPANAY